MMFTDFESGKSLFWITNVPIHYRWPIWSALHSRISFELLFFSPAEKNQDKYTEIFSPGYRYYNLRLRQHYFLSNDAFYFGVRKLIYILSHQKKFKSFYLDGWVSPPFIVSAFLIKLKKKQLLIGYRGTSDSHHFNNSIVRFIRSRVLNLADFIITAGKDSTNAVLSMGISESKIVTLFNPVDVNWFQSNIRKYRTTGSPGHKFLYVGQLIQRKNILSLVRAFHSVSQPGDTLSIVGEGNLENDLKALVQSLGLQSSVFLLGSKSQQELISIYAFNNTLVLPSEKEVWGLVANEALACGLHVVVSDKCGVTEFIRDMKGVYVSAVDSISIADSMRESRTHWKDHISSPEIMEFSPEKFATEIIGLLET